MKVLRKTPYSRVDKADIPARAGGLLIAVHYVPGRTSATSLEDFCDMLPLPGGGTGLVVGGVRPGPGGHAPLRASTLATRAALRAAAYGQHKPSQVIGGLSQALRAWPSQEQPLLCAAFATVRPVFRGALLRVCSSGGALPLVRRASGAVQVLGQPTPMIGTFPAPELSDVRRLLRAGDSLILVTDSVAQARGEEDGSPFGVAKLPAVVADQPSASAQGIAAGILRAVARHAGGQIDRDVVAVVAKIPAS